jgi:hypothetical protein
MFSPYLFLFSTFLFYRGISFSYNLLLFTVQVPASSGQCTPAQIACRLSLNSCERIKREETEFCWRRGLTVWRLNGG